MGIAAYNRGSKAIAEQIRRDFARPQEYILPSPAPVTTIPSEDFRVGEWLRCKVNGQLCEVVQTKDYGSKQRIKVAGFRSWCPAYNFKREVNP